MQGVAALWVALAIDRWLGEPPPAMHPVRWMGAFLGWMGGLVAPRAGIAASTTAAKLMALVAGAAAWCLGAALAALASFGLLALAHRLPGWAAGLLVGIALKPLFAWRMLHDEVAAVETALGRSLAQGRSALGRLVSRDVSALDATQVREGAIESLAENLNDSLVAPLFWFVLFGLPGAAVYRFANTADAMWGYRGERGGRQWEWAGKWAARADDVLSWLPARLTALLLMPPVASARQLLVEARKTASPNGGWPMSAMALKLDLRLAKPGSYLLHPEGRAPGPADIPRALRAATLATWGAAICASIAFMFAGL